MDSDMGDFQGSTDNSNWPMAMLLYVPGFIFLLSFAYGVGVYVGNAGVDETLIKLKAHEQISIHNGAVPRSVYEVEIRQLREALARVDQRLDRLEGNRDATR